MLDALVGGWAPGPTNQTSRQEGATTAPFRPTPSVSTHPCSSSFTTVASAETDVFKVRPYFVYV